ncbi:DUF7537 family lipoprotein [Haloplanus aerogenes]|uniref:Uncharacterized protein n=1 Tax=Haloplanus aerogenes TaxID=660522 RepID=A0A3M0CYR3_9EURY|nr:hypothetical protein [Haloplanus aerogenes]AZH26770.1 hypothetical protein DU502_15930 [Haloplanus aerogenes]RMB09143.1 hypothetical protein ATH50_3514 [Haloplanus aerogenes]
MRQGWTTVLAALLVVTAGCAGFAPDGDETPAVTETATPTPSNPSAVTYPSGWNATGVNASVALRSHYTAVLTGPSATVTYRSEVVESEGIPRRNTTLDMRLDTADRRLYASIEGKTNHRIAYFADGTLSRWDARNETLVGQSSARFGEVAQSIDNGVLYSHLLLYDLEFERTVRRQGTTALVYDVTGAYSNTLSRTYGSARDATGQVVVAADGRVLEIETTVTYSEGTLRYHYAQTRVGETDVAMPDWLSSA